MVNYVMGSVMFSTALRGRLEGMVRSGYPEETCGLLVGTGSAARVRVHRVIQARNLNTERARDRYELDPAAFIAADKAARAAGMDVVGFWHSHPDHAAEPSETDRAGAWAGYRYLIVGVTREGISELRCWRMGRSRFVEETLES